MEQEEKLGVRYYCGWERGKIDIVSFLRLYFTNLNVALFTSVRELSFKKLGVKFFEPCGKKGLSLYFIVVVI